MKKIDPKNRSKKQEYKRKKAYNDQEKSIESTEHLDTKRERKKRRKEIKRKQKK